MREIKFRAWDILNFRMIKPNEIYRLYFVEGTCYGIELQDGGQCRNFELKQYTNKKDKNNNEIFEDDCLKWKDNIFRVKWDKFNARWYGKPHIGNINRGILMAITFENSEIIGNIFENPELIK